ncbi:uncharacterized protein LOC126978462 isoform X1 [Leptidea sinapis]|uniref:uncharacterized protein LOC126978462 isoform X1 n=1 Tax=Leptidea sinapis TaxID=189913 RepID=UPI002136AA97|nr:uncharacterized protein LOC126978462 isoform X1 [Leptidea sinapis]XP_050683246.1 uncharacterized protein LOC126978462 isoform X1 [Leptidea sinapis]XP_050683254.1 uncharacterized protein LOC126978462 isoform X1 [Leptidea sinapis]XP_050683262.1 uncharacterized protein LOC126978462 isoform X1 [Leptidea sinapis]XP_050683272.1 uncharacterized protein LOC126978462 isoform X1 [Leptidea sinapis]XP_050683279.1 uncharacterized protein LOC126978462 isoform X1 [Leptidea sinapis]XP_050683287.1 uncharac
MMLDLNGVSLGERQAELNYKVAEAVKNKINFKDLEALEENSDVDKLYKIDIASKLKRIHYIQGVLKCGDSLYVSRALKYDFIYGDEFSAIINPDNLNQEIFPYMSLRMKKKLLENVASRVRNQTRLQSFFEYCMKIRMFNLAFKFSICLSELTKLYILNTNFDFIKNQKNCQLFIGDSFILALAYILKLDIVSQDIVMKFSNLFLVDAEKYLDMIEKHYHKNASTRFGARVSKSIMTKHKDRVLRNPFVYIHILHKKVLAHHSTSEDAKSYIRDLLPDHVDDFWLSNIYSTYKYIFDLIPKSEIFQFYKSAFTNKYETDFFEMNVQFYYLNYFEFLSQEERENIALKHIEAGEELLGENYDFIWYKFVDYEVAFPAIKKCLLVTNDSSIRNDMFKTLVNSARNQRHLENLFIYYYERHVNEPEYYKDVFIDTVADNKNIFEFDEGCWTAFNKILYSIEVYTPGCNKRDRFRAFCIIYHIINDIEMPEALIYYILHDFNSYEFLKHRDKLTDAQWLQIYDNMYEVHHKHMNEINERLITGAGDTQIKNEMLEQIRKFLSLLEFFKKSMNDIPKNILNFITSNIDYFQYCDFFRKDVKEEKITESLLLRLLKKDKRLLILDKTRKNKIFDKMNDDIGLRLNRFAMVLKIYFSNDAIAKEFLEFFQSCIGKATYDYKYYRVIKTAVCSLFQLADEDYKVNLMSKYAPIEAKIDHKNIGRDVLSIQEAICRHAGYSRPPVPLSSILQYIKGDYVHFCLPIFNMYLADLPLPKAMQFIEAVLNAPVSIQKHGIRLAFKMFSTEKLEKLVRDIWNKSKNVSIRMIIYKDLFAKVKNTEGDDQKQLFEILKTFTKTLHEDDQEEVFKLIKSNEMPEQFRAEYLNAAWFAIKLFSFKKNFNMRRKIMIVQTIENNIALIEKKYIRTEIIDEFVKEMLDEDGLAQEYKPREYELNAAMWSLIETFIFFVRNEEDLSDSQELLKTITASCQKSWDRIHEDKYILREFLCTFLNKNKSKCCDGCDVLVNQINTKSLLELCLQSLQKLCPLQEVYLNVLGLKLNIATRKVLSYSLTDLDEIARLFIKEVLPILNGMINRNIFCKIFISKISSEINSCICVMASYHNNWDAPDILTIHVCSELLGVNKSTSLLALTLMPTDAYTDHTRGLMKCFLDDLKKINDFEVQSYYYDKFYASSYSVGYFVQFNEDENKTFDCTANENEEPRVEK